MDNENDGPADYLGLIALADRLIAEGFHEFAADALNDAERVMGEHPMHQQVEKWAAAVRAEARRRAILSRSIVLPGIPG